MARMTNNRQVSSNIQPVTVERDPEQAPVDKENTAQQPPKQTPKASITPPNQFNSGGAGGAVTGNRTGRR